MAGELYQQDGDTNHMPGLIPLVNLAANVKFCDFLRKDIGVLEGGVVER